MGIVVYFSIKVISSGIGVDFMTAILLHCPLTGIYKFVGRGGVNTKFNSNL